MSDLRDPTGPSPGEAAKTLAEAVEAAVRDLEERLPLGMGPFERAEAARIRVAARRLLACGEQLDSEPLIVAGSTGQRRSHPLLKTEQDLRREVSSSLQSLIFRAEQRASFERMQAIHRRRRHAPEPEEPS